MSNQRDDSAPAEGTGTPEYLQRADYGSGKHKHPASTRLDDEDIEFLMSLHPQKSTALRLAVKRLRAICGMCSNLHTSSLDSASEAG